MDNLLSSITGLSADSRKIEPGNMFVAISGTHQDGMAFVHQAVEKGAKIVVIPEGRTFSHEGVEIVHTKNPRSFLAQAAAGFYARQPQRIAAVTGTNGKTSTVNFTRQIWEKIGRSAASIGTLGVTGHGISGYSGMTTPDPVDLHRTFQELADKNINRLAMEASSIGIEQYRLDGVRLSAAGFTNLTRDHLDYHDTMESYLHAKRRLFGELLPEGATAIVNADTPEFADIEKLCKSRNIACWGYGSEGKELRLLARDILPEGQALSLEIFGQKFDLLLPLVGEFQAMNMLCACGLVLSESAALADRVVEAMSSVSGVAGRLQKVSGAPENIGVYVDYAHTPDALENILNALRPHVTGRLICLFGCGGDRDNGKRPVMGEISSRLADVTIVTDDNPRSENADHIRAQIISGCIEFPIEIGGRRHAIREAVSMLRNGDVLVLAGKGHEQGQIFADHTEPFDDLAEAGLALKESFP